MWYVIPLTEAGEDAGQFGPYTKEEADDVIGRFDPGRYRIEESRKEAG